MPDLRRRFGSLDDLPVPDLRRDIEAREPRETLVHGRSSARARVGAAVVALAVFAAAGFVAWRAFAPGEGGRRVSEASRVYRDPAGWSIHTPRGWNVLPFDVSDPSDPSLRFEGVQVSNVELPRPMLEPGTPIQARALPESGVAVIVARSFGPPGGDEVSLPLSLDEFSVGSAERGPVLRSAYFAAGGWTFVATVKTGAGADGEATLRTIEHTVASFSFAQPSTAECVSSQLSARVAGSEGAAGTMFETLRLTNTSTSTCHVEGSPSVEVLSPSGDPLAIATRSGLPEGPALQASTVVLDPGGEADLVVAFTDVTVGDQPCLEVGSLRIGPASSGGSLNVPLSPGAEICNGVIWVAPFTASTEAP